MANLKQSRKRVRQAEKRRAHNKGRSSMMRTAIKNVVYAIEAGDKEAASNAYKKMVPMVDVAAQNRLIHRNKAARYKSRLNKHIRAM